MPCSPGLPGGTGGFVDAVTGRWREIGELKLGQIGALLGPALSVSLIAASAIGITLAMLLFFDA